MGFNQFRIQLTVRIILLSASIFGFIYLLINTQLTFTIILLALIIVTQVTSLIYYTEKTNRLLNQFLMSIRYSDFTRTFQVENNDSSLDQLKRTFNEVIDDFQTVRAEKEESYHYLQTIIQHIGIALIAFQSDGKVELINNATKKLFQIRTLNNIQNLQETSRELVQKLLTIQHGENTLVTIREKEGLLQLSIYATEFRIHNRNIMVVSIKDIQNELDEKEMDSWQKLIRVLTHEIMNSITPISSLSSTVNMMMNHIIESLKEKDEGCTEETEDLLEIQSAISTIQKRTEGLIHFVDTYRNLTRIPTPHFSIFPVQKLLQNIYNLHRNELEQKGIKCTISVLPASLELSADERLIEQVLINLLLNAIQALNNATTKNIELKAFLNKNGKITIQIIDTGSGILPEAIDKIFIPFFTTKQQGSGIGLSLSRQIMRLHSGTLNVYSEPDNGSKFTLTF
jgi:nitrogen fixation/metabolism regulation signal transduction histidine kinase